MKVNLEIVIRIPELWGAQEFKKDTWAPVNFLVGPNGTGKTLFAERLKEQCQRNNLQVRYLNAERITGFERYDYSGMIHSYITRGLDLGQLPTYKGLGLTHGAGADAFLVLREKLDVRLRIEAILEDYLRRRIRLCEEGGFLRTKLRRLDEPTEYDLKQGECHGLKELITLLTFLYDDEYNCLIIDEPELHLHPQFQSFFLQQVRSVAGDPLGGESDRKLVFLLTHSPYCVDIRSVDDLCHCLVFVPGRPPTFIARLDPEDEYKVRRLIPRLNTHHKQFFFSTRPVFVEGYQDQQLYALIQERRGRFMGAWGASIIDVGGKDELDLFFRVCRQLAIDGHFIADLDVIFEGNLRQSVASDERCRQFVQQKGLGTDLMRIVGELERAIGRCVEALVPALDQRTACDPGLHELRDALASTERSEDDLPRKRRVLAIALARARPILERLLPTHSDDLYFIQGRLEQICLAMESAGVHVLPHGELVHYLPSYHGNPYKVSDDAKRSAFETEREALLTGDLSEQDVLARYGSLVEILDAATSSRVPDFVGHLNYLIADWIHKVQSAVVRGEVKDADSLRVSPLVEWSTYSRILELPDFQKTPTGFTCRVRLKPSVDPFEREFQFDETDVPASYRLPT